MTPTDYDRELRVAFDLWAPTYEDDATAKIAARGHSYMSMGRDIARLATGPEPVLEVGVGSGLLGAQVAGHLDEMALHGLDISPAMLELARARGVYERLDLVAADAFDYRSSYNLVYTAFAFHSIRDQAQFLAKVKGSLTANGTLLVIDLFPTEPLTPEVSNEHSRLHEKGAPSNYVTEHELRQLAEGAGFEVGQARVLGERRAFEHRWFELNG